VLNVGSTRRQGSRSWLERTWTKKERNVSHPQMLYYLANAQIDEAQRLARSARRAAKVVKTRRRARAQQPSVAPVERVEEVERVPSLV
jgi:cytosine/adenosine deaminase-related metal-dependent hydrolase